jgi:hypothetical protein
MHLILLRSSAIYAAEDPCLKNAAFFGVEALLLHNPLHSTTFLHPTNSFTFKYNSPHRSAGRTAKTHYLYHKDRNLQRRGYKKHPDTAVKTD